MDIIARKMLEILIVVILSCLLAFGVVSVIAPELIPPIGEDRVNQTEPDMAKINNRLNAIGDNLSDIEKKMDYIDPDDYRNLSVLDSELKGSKTYLSELEREISGLNNTSTITDSIKSINSRTEVIQYQIGEKKDKYYADILDYGLKGFFAGIVLCICIVTIPYLQYRRGKLYGLIGHGGEKEYARNRFRKFLYVMILSGLIILGSGLVLVILRIILI